MSVTACGGDTAPVPAEPPIEDALPLEPTELLRRISFDVRGGPPSDEEYAQVQEVGDVPDALIDEMLASDAFLDQVEAWHAEVLWPNISRYRLSATPLTAARQSRIGEGEVEWENVGRIDINPNSDIGADPALVRGTADQTGEELRAEYVLGFENGATAIQMRGGGSYQNRVHYCDQSPEAEYPAFSEDILGTAANEYEVSAEESGDGVAYTANYYSEDPAHPGLVMPIQDYRHCTNYCVLSACLEEGSALDPNSNSDVPRGEDHPCYQDQLAEGWFPEGERHRFDRPGYHCADGYERVVNSCDYSEPEFTPLRAFVGGHVTSFNKRYDGWVWMEHYWSNGVAIRTCALESQEREQGLLEHPNGEDGVQSCAAVRRDQGFGWADPSCGCGPQGVYCQPSQREYRTSDETRTEARLRNAIEQEPLQIIRSVVAGDEDYLSILTTRRSFVNGPLALAWEHQWRVLLGEGRIRIDPPSESNPLWGGVDYESEEWAEYERDERHSGILTTLEFLVRFPTARSRVAQFRRVFACSNEFDYAPSPDPADTNPDIAERSGCGSCHSRLEEDGMWFGRYPDRNGIYLSESEFPIVNDECRVCALGDERFTDPESRNSQLYKCGPDFGGSEELVDLCETRYAHWGNFGTREESYAGHLWPTIYRDPALYGRINEGARGMVDAELARGDALQTCAAENAWERLVRRPATRGEIERLTSQFEDAGRGYRALVRAVVTSEAYRSTGPEETP